MALPSISDEKLSALLKRTFPSAHTSSPDAAQLSAAVFTKLQYTTAENVEINHWFATARELASPRATTLEHLNTHLSTRTTLLGTKPSIADIALYAYLAPLLWAWDRTTRTGPRGYHHLVRHASFVQHAPLFGPLQLAPDCKPLNIDADDVEARIPPVDAKERKKKEKDAAAAASTPRNAAEQQPPPAAAAAARPTKKDKKDKPPRQPQPAAPTEKPIGPALIDLRVGLILKAEPHPNADTLYVSTIACGDAAGAENTALFAGRVCRTVCSGLVGRVPLEAMSGATVAVIANLKPVTMRGVKSCAMVFCASERVAEGGDAHAARVELLRPPEACEPGDRIWVEGFEGEPDAVLNPKKKVFETVQPGFFTTEDLDVVWDIERTALAGEGDGKKTGKGRLMTKHGLLKARSIVNASCS